MDIKEIQSLIKFVAKSGASEVKLEMEDLKITIRTGTHTSGNEPTYVQQIPVAQAQMAPAQLNHDCLLFEKLRKPNGHCRKFL